MAQVPIQVNVGGDGGVNQPSPAARSMSDYISPDVEEHDSINVLGVEANNFEIKPVNLHLVTSDQFGGSPTEDPNSHITKFLRICGTFKINGVPQEAIKFRFFPFSLRHKGIFEEALSNFQDPKDEKSNSKLQIVGKWVLHSFGTNTCRRAIGENTNEWIHLLFGEIISSKKLVGGMHEVEQISALSAKVDNVASLV
ncbi:PREDICTED: uncharacterized protein LOC109163339 [Ipomoea nil]|uniref:uncharacterized protein LOC109163339 n=1 Tax=Ipomoea nil TaxID=35883 RepID=UPI00090089EA|nr:PREDICTED: uncharacterized protein LOC109163339 [Ipomoea nil]